ncbi:transposase family protein [Synechococcus sp. RedBA-s]|uniref:transposase family protein n=1 Tax=Synechococcus sp. RedBA-s TaxID=2823741 RepID=UPI0020CC5385|nr:transposase family protein [Synechococcus sp. RedBA-s]MCP9801876.1 transposase family protein [Synechococcus sp. RedBA-s]
MGFGRWYRPVLVPETAPAATDLDLISYLQAIPDARMRRGGRIPAWYLLLVAVLGVLSGCQSLRDLERFARRHHGALTQSLGLELRRPPSDSAFRYFFLQVDVAALCAAIRDWTIAQIPGGATDLDQLVCVALGFREAVGKTLRGSIESTKGGGSAFIAQVTLYSAALGVAISQACYATGENHERTVLKQLLGELDLEGVLIQADALHTQKPFSGSSRSRGPTSC